MDLFFKLSRNKKAETALKKWPSMNFLKFERVFWTSRAQTQTHTYTNKERDKGNTFFGRPPVEYLIGCNIVHIFSVFFSRFLQAAYKDWANCPSSSFHKLRPFEFSCRNPQWNLNFMFYSLAIFCCLSCLCCNTATLLYFLSLEKNKHHSPPQLSIPRYTQSTLRRFVGI